MNEHVLAHTRKTGFLVVTKLKSNEKTPLSKKAETLAAFDQFSQTSARDSMTR